MNVLNDKKSILTRLFLKKASGTVSLVPLLLLLFVCLILSVAYKEDIMGWMANCMESITH